MPESLSPSRIIIINSKRLYHPIRDMGRPELRIPPYIALHSPVHPCRDFRKIFSQKIPVKLPKIPETSRKDGAKIFRKNCEKSLSALHEIPSNLENPQNRSKCNTAQNFSQNFFSNFFSKIFHKIFSAKSPEIQHCKEFFTKFFHKIFWRHLHTHLLIISSRRFARDSRL